jgi:hypothetical protein
MRVIFVASILAFGAGSSGATTIIDAKLRFDDNVYQASQAKTSDFSLRLTGKYLNSVHSGRLYLEKFFSENRLDNFGGEYGHTLPYFNSNWELNAVAFIQQYLRKDNNLADDNIDLVAVGLESFRDYKWSSFKLKIVPDIFFYFFSGAANRRDLRPSINGDLIVPLNERLDLATGTGVVLNFSSDRDYSYFKNLLYGGVRYEMSQIDDISVKVTFSNTSYSYRYGASASVYNNRGKYVGSGNQNEAVSSINTDIIYERHVDEMRSMGAQVTVYSQKSVSDLLDYSSNTFGCWYSYNF